MSGFCKLTILVGVCIGSVATGIGARAFAITDYGVSIDRLDFGSQIVQCFCTDLWGTDITSATITTPADAIPPNAVRLLQYDPDEDQWAFDDVAPEHAIESEYPDGTYRFDVRYTDGTTDTRFVDLIRSFPPLPVLSSFTSDQLTWEPWDGAPAGEGIEVYVESEDGAVHSCALPTAATSCAFPPGFVDGLSAYTAEILFLSPSNPNAYSNAGSVTIHGAIGAGRVPDGDQLPGIPLAVTKGEGVDVSLTWGDSCAATDTDFAVYSGSLEGAFDRHEPVTCTTGGVPTLADVEAVGSRYFLVVPHNGTVEGSSGARSAGERPQGYPFCLLQQLAVCE